MGENIEQDHSYKLIFEIDNFSGPLDLLLDLIKTQKIDINNIPIVQITSQFLDFINRYGDQLLDRLGDYLVMASKLTLIKAKMLLPKKAETYETEGFEEEEEDPRTELKNQLLAYDKFNKIASALNDRKLVHKLEYTRDEIFASEWEKPTLKEGAVSLDQLVSCMQEIISNAQERNQVFNVIERINVSSEEVENRIKEIIQQEGKTTFSQLIKEFPSIDGVVTCFVKILAMMRVQEIKVTQNEEFGELVLEKTLAA